MASIPAFFQSKRGKLILIGLVLSIALIVLISILTDPYDCRMAPDTYVGGLNLSGMTKKEAREALETGLNQHLLTQELVIRLPEETIRLAPDRVVQKTALDKAVKDAYRHGRKETPSGEFSLLNYITPNEAAIRDALNQYATAHNTEYAPMEYRLEGAAPLLSTAAYQEDASAQTLSITLGIPEVKLDVDAMYAQILTVLEQALVSSDEEYQLTVDSIEPLTVPEEVDVEAIYAELAQVAVNDSLDMETYEFVAGSYGYGFDQEAAKAAVAAAKPGETVEIPMTLEAPEILGDQVYFRDELGHCETRHTNDENRNTNLRLLCEALDGLVLQPGEEFSYNVSVGERTPERGFKPANAYSGTRLVKDYGGGVCQGSTTLYNCALLADLEILERVCHGATVGYVPLGLDAAVNWNTKTDLRFRNNFHFPMMLKAEVSDGYVRMKILGTDEKDYYIEMKSGSSSEGDVVYAVSYKCKYSKETGELLRKDVEARSSYYPLG